VVENKPGGVMTIGATEVLKQLADGHTIFSVTAPVAAAPALVPSYVTLCRAAMDVAGARLPDDRRSAVEEVLARWS